MYKNIPKFPRKWTPKHPDKYDGNPNNVIVRSSWEVKFLNWCDMNSSIKSYSSEELIIPYLSPIDNKVHRYFPDVKFETIHNKIFLIEIKPFNQTIPPSAKYKNGRKRQSHLLVEETKTFMVNQAKWNAAKAYCDQRNWTFKIITEHELGIKS